MQAKRPERGKTHPGAAWHYNNWDFNALGTIYERCVGQDLDASFDERIARPIGIEDFTGSDARRVFELWSDHPAHTFRLTARDLARVGQLFLNGGTWGSRQVLPARWVEESTRMHSRTDRGSQGYGYCWWTLPADSPFGPGAYAAFGNGGQALAMIPSKQLVVAQTVDVRESREHLDARDLTKLLRQIFIASPTSRR